MRDSVIRALFAEWERDLSPDDRSDLVEAYFKEAGLGESQRVGCGTSVFVSTESSSATRVHCLVIGRHDVGDLSPAPASGPTGATLHGPGIASRLGPTAAFAEGVQAARALTDDDRVTVSFLSLGDGDSISNLNAILPDTEPDAVFVTNAAAWSPDHPTITTGCRGQLTVQLALHAGQHFDDYLGSGAVRNPLTKLAQILGGIRDDRGRIQIDGFYNRAQAPDAAARAQLSIDDHDPDHWADHADISRFYGRLSTLERATMWPGFSVLNIEAETPGTTRSPASALATVAFYLVPDQRHSEVEAAVRQWFVESTPEQLRPSMHVLQSTRPFQGNPSSAPIAAQARAAYRVHGRHPIFVPAGGPAGSGELAFTVGAPVAFAGISPPSTSLGTTQESLSWAHLVAGTELAAETCLQLRRE